MLYLLAGLLHIVIIIMLLYVSLIAAVSNSVSGRRTFAYGIPRLFICFQKFRFRHG
jgi:cytochrome b561